MKFREYNFSLGNIDYKVVVGPLIGAVEAIHNSGFKFASLKRAQQMISLLKQTPLNLSDISTIPEEFGGSVTAQKVRGAQERRKLVYHPLSFQHRVQGCLIGIPTKGLYFCQESPLLTRQFDGSDIPSDSEGKSQKLLLQHTIFEGENARLLEEKALTGVLISRSFGDIPIPPNTGLWNTFFGDSAPQVDSKPRERSSGIVYFPSPKSAVAKQLLFKEGYICGDCWPFGFAYTLGVKQK